MFDFFLGCTLRLCGAFSVERFVQAKAEEASSGGNWK